ncbi:hypothetical protein AVEN_40612-1 [Araneus ventricosus]|uniref:Uncharacterized protein n=1 Tax=Araneus ventricosus TaxID=182803 RepID=A0A4Y2JAS0_ARAVE|nr:hypothetical protein AVEN_40612-1 [Araneus ventricosus]
MSPQGTTLGPVGGNPQTPLSPQGTTPGSEGGKPKSPISPQGTTPKRPQSPKQETPEGPSGRERTTPAKIPLSPEGGISPEIGKPKSGVSVRPTEVQRLPDRGPRSAAQGKGRNDDALKVWLDLYLSTSRIARCVVDVQKFAPMCGVEWGGQALPGTPHWRHPCFCPLDRWVVSCQLICLPCASTWAEFKFCIRL